LCINVRYYYHQYLFLQVYLLLLELLGTRGADGLIFKEEDVAVCWDGQFACAANQTFSMVLLVIDDNDLAVAENLATAGASLHATHAAQESVNKGWFLVAEHVIALLAVEACSVIAHALVHMSRQHSRDKAFAGRADGCTLGVTLGAHNSLGSRHHVVLGLDLLVALAALEAVLFGWRRGARWRWDRSVCLGSGWWRRDIGGGRTQARRCTTCRGWNSSRAW